MKISIVSATPFEIAPLLSHLENNGTKKSFYEFEYNNHTIIPLVTGIGMVNTALSLSRFNHIESTDLFLNLGIAGSFSKDFKLGSIVEIVKDRFGDIGVEDADGQFKDHMDMQWEEEDTYPYKNGWLVNNDSKHELGLPKVNGITVNKVHGAQDSINSIKGKYNAHTESMEGAAFMLFCKFNDLTFHQVRSISNYVEPRNKDAWEIELAIDNLNKTVLEFIKKLS